MNYPLIKQTFLFICFSFFAMTATMAQSEVEVKQEKIEVEDEEMKSYAKALNKLQEVQTELQNTMVEIVTKEGIDVETYSRIQRASAERKVNPEAEFDFPEDIIEKYNKAAKEVAELQKKANFEMQEILDESDIELARFQEISVALQSDTDLQRQFQEEMEDLRDDD